MKVHNSFGSLALAAAMTIWIVSVAASASSRGPNPGAPARGLDEAAFSDAAQQPPPAQQKPDAPQQKPDPAQQKPDPAQQKPQPAGAAGEGQKPAAPAAPAPKPAIPAAASSIAAKPENFYGQNVTVYATVEKQLTDTAFVLDQDKTKSTGQEVIVLARRLHEKLEPNTYVTVIGEVVRPDAAEIAKIAKESAAGLPADVLAQHAGKPVIFATAVINPALNDLAKFIPPPMTPEEQVLDKNMKAVGQANGAVRKGVEASNAEIVKTNTAILAKAFADTEAFWKKRGKEDAVKIAQTARAAVDGLDKSAAMGNWNEAKKQVAALGQQCQSCHGTFRERLEDGSFAVKKDTGQ
jgi:cytochrome c556